MTPGARVAAAIEILDTVLQGAAAEKVLTTWGRTHRFAGSKDRAAIRDHVFDALRRLHSAAAMGGAMTGRGVMLGLLRQDGAEVAALFSGDGHAPAALDAAERDAGRPPAGPTALDCPEWLAPSLEASLGADFAPAMERLRHRAAVFLRVNTLKADTAMARSALAAEGIETRPHPLSPTALEATGGARRIARSQAFRSGLVELQDAASQAVADLVPVEGAGRVLDFCAGGGGKALALAPRVTGRLVAHDAHPQRMSDLPARTARAGAEIACLMPEHLSAEPPFDVVLADAPCSGSGAWRRAPEGKWRLTPEKLAALTGLQAEILDAAARRVAPGGVLAYATCSLLDAENAAQVAAFTAHRPDWRCTGSKRFSPCDGGDGFFVALLQKEHNSDQPVMK